MVLLMVQKQGHITISSQKHNEVPIQIETLIFRFNFYDC